MQKQGLLLVALIATLLLGCKADGNYPGVEFAPQMYQTVPYEPLTQITKEGIPSGVLERNYYITNSLPFNKYQSGVNSNVLLPVEGTVARQSYQTVTNSNVSYKGQALLIYDIPKDSIAYAARVLKNPLPDTETILADGKALYMSYCSSCHGESGDGQGKVGKVYLGVPNYQAGATSKLNEGHIFHVITHGIRRMWAHKSQLNPEERWKIVRYVQKLQKGEN